MTIVIVFIESVLDFCDADGGLIYPPPSWYISRNNSV